MVIASPIQTAILLLLSLNILAQTPSKQNAYEDYRQFKSLFDEVLGNDSAEDTLNSLNYSFVSPEVLPPWIENAFLIFNDSILIPGISDPLMDHESGLAIARMRAVNIYTLFHPVKVSNMREYLSMHSEEAGINEIFMEFTRLNTHLSLLFDPHTIEATETHSTRYKETVALFKFPVRRSSSIEQDVNTVYYETDLFTMMRIAGNKSEIEEKLEMGICTTNSIGEETCMIHNYIKLNNLANSITWYNNNMLTDLPGLNLHYRSTNLVSAIDDLQGIPLRNGLWHALISGLLNKLADEVHKGSIHFKQVGDFYQQQSTRLNREIAIEMVMLKNLSIQIQDNRLFMFF